MASKPTKTTNRRGVKKSAQPRRLPGTLSDEVLLQAFRPDRRFLGGLRASVIVLSAANTVVGDLSRTLRQLALDPADVTKRVQNEVRAAGYVPADVPCSVDTRLIDLVTQIQNSQKA